MTSLSITNPLTTIDRRALQRISTPDGAILVVAADQRNSMRAVMSDDPEVARQITAAQLREAKADLVSVLGQVAPAILLDPEVALPHVVDTGALPRDCAMVVGMDASGYEVDAEGLRHTRGVDGVSARRVRELGGDVAKMLFYLRPDRQSADSAVGEQIRTVQAECDAEGVLLIVEILTYALAGEAKESYRAGLADLVAESARLSVACGAKLLKLPYPGSAEGCARVTEAAAGVPWTVLSAGVGIDEFLAQIRIARANGAAGAMAGRSIWKDALSLDPTKRRALLTDRALPRLRNLADALGGR